MPEYAVETTMFFLKNKFLQEFFRVPYPIVVVICSFINVVSSLDRIERDDMIHTSFFANIQKKNGQKQLNLLKKSHFFLEVLCVNPLCLKTFAKDITKAPQIEGVLKL
ncbi:MAG: hypothetical protein LBE18_02490, partial [Planctomycetaceae bacterium]|nr:hypothetical protein [Planctomycetaceae bacterium]